MNNRVSTASSSGGIHVQSGTSPQLYDMGFKRLFDIFLSVALLPILLPVIAILYVVVRADGGPGFFGHSRVGRDGRSFKCWKVRTMVTDAQERLDALLADDADARAEWERDHKLENDPRVTRIGNFLRRTSLDELPQIFNVLKGEMSLVGPRPVTTPELERYGTQKDVYLSMRPGVTGLWQVSGRNQVSYAERVSMDTAYYNSVSLGTDLVILAKTGGAVLNKTGR